MADVRISSRKHDSRNGRSRHHFAGDLHSDKFGIIFSGDSLILNLTDGERGWSVIFEENATGQLTERFAARARQKEAA